MNKLRPKDMSEAKRFICQLEGANRDLKRQLLEADKCLSKHDNWISVKDELPTAFPHVSHFERCLVCNDGNVQWALFNTKLHIFQDSKYTDITKQVTHWQPITPPKGGRIMSKLDELKTSLRLASTLPADPRVKGLFIQSREVIEDLQQQITELQARVEVLEGLCDAADCPQCSDKSGVYADNYGEACQCQWCYERNQTPKQSLAHIQADAVIEYGKAIVGWVHREPVPRPEKYAQQLREQAKE